MEESATTPIVICAGAVTQKSRRLKALESDYARPDERSLADLLNFAPAYGSLINFYNLNNTVDGDWRDFFQQDPSIVLATIAQIDLSRIEAEFVRLKSSTRGAASFDLKFEFLKKTYGVCYRLALNVNRWLRWLEVTLGGTAARLMAQAIVFVIKSELAQPLQTLLSYDKGAGLPGALGRPIGFDYKVFLDLWQLENVPPDGSIFSGTTPNRKIDHSLPYLDAVLQPLIHGIEELQRSALVHFAGSLEDSAEHKPNNALYIAFAQLFQMAQQSINTFPSRYINFYYREILQEKFLGALPDSLYLTFTLAASESVHQASVPKGTLFSAGQDADGMEILYAADKNLLVTEAAIARLLTLRVVKGPLFLEPPPDQAQQEVIQSIFSSTILLQNNETSADVSNSVSASPWSTFGRAQAGTSPSEATAPAVLGFALASDYLLLTGGHRKIKVSVQYFDSRLSGLIEQIAQATGLAADEILRGVLDAAFKLYVSTATGWLPIERYAACLDALSTSEEGSAPHPQFHLCFELPSSAPAIVAYDPEAGTETAAVPGAADAVNPAPWLPTLKAYLRQEPVCLTGNSGSVCVYPLSLLAGLEVAGLDLKICVKRLAGLQLENTDGPIDPSAPFYVFGGLPVKGSYLLVRHAELFVKKIQGLQIGIEWFNLPQNEDGFKGYYRDYILGLDGQKQRDLFDNQVFHAALSVQNPGLWFLQTPGAPCPDAPPPVPVDAYLFRTANDCKNEVPIKDGPLCPATCFDKLSVCPSQLPPYYEKSASAIKLALAAPTYAFGDDLYAQNVLKAVIDDLPNASTCQEECDAQCKPLADAAQWIANCLAQCQGVPDDQYKTCIQPYLGVCLTQLLLAFAECVAECFPGDKSTADAREAGLKASIDECHHCEGNRRAQLLRDLQSRWVPALGASDCGNVCIQLLQAAADIAESAVGCAVEENYKQCLQKALADCQNSLQQAHALCLQTCMDNCMKIKKELKYPNAPYLPQATAVTVNYSTSCSFTADRDCGVFFHLLPFDGYRAAFASRDLLLSRTQVAPESPGLPALLPQFAFAGALYLGFSGLRAAQRMNLLFQMSASGGQNNVDELPPVQWECLSGDRWTPLQPAQLIADSTNGLENTGIVTLDLPLFKSAENIILSEAHAWLRATVAGSAGAFPPTVAIDPHALTATWRDNGGAYDHLKKPLPAQTISSSVQDLPDIETIYQPLESFDGLPSETEQTFYLRVGERLRHKDRAVLCWDHERLVLQRFPTVWKVQALPESTLRRGAVPGSVLVVVIAGPDSNQLQDPTSPLASSAMLAAIKNYLQQLASPFIQIEVVNPMYVRTKVIATVQFQENENSGDYLKQLNKELVERLSPWFDDTSSLSVRPPVENTPCLSEDAISEFIQTRPYVLALDSIEFKYEPDPATLEWYVPTSARQHELQDAGTISPLALGGNFY